MIDDLKGFARNVLAVLAVILVLAIGAGFSLGRCTAPDPPDEEPLLDPVWVETVERERDSVMVENEALKYVADSLAAIAQAPRPPVVTITVLDTVESPVYVVPTDRVPYVHVLMGPDTAIAPKQMVLDFLRTLEEKQEADLALIAMAASRNAEKAGRQLAERRRDEAIAMLHAAQEKVADMEPACRIPLGITSMPCPSRTAAAIAGGAGALALLFVTAR